MGLKILFKLCRITNSINSYDGNVRHKEELLKVLLSVGNINVYRHGTTALCEACRCGNPDTVRILLKHGAAIAARDHHGCSPLYIAASNGHVETTRLLITSGADVNETVKKGFTPLWSSVYNKHEIIARMLIEAGASVTILDEFFWDFFFRKLLIGWNNLSLVETMVNAGVHPVHFDRHISEYLLRHYPEFTRKLILIGFTLDYSYVQTLEPNDEGDEFVIREHENPHPLIRFCRTVIRKSLSVSPCNLHIKKKIMLLPIPSDLKKYLSYEYLSELYERE